MLKQTMVKLFELIIFFSLIIPQQIFAESIFFAGYKDGFYIKSEEEAGIELRIGGDFETDYRYFGEDERADNGFDIRKASIIFEGSLTRYFRYGLEYEFQGNETKHLVDAYGEAVCGRHSLRFGQFKEPFSLEWQTVDKGLYFAERSMGYYLTPGRDIGVMLHGLFFDQSFIYAFGMFNGDGIDGSTSGNQNDDPEMAARLVYAPFKNKEIKWLDALQFGGSATYAKIELNNVDLEIKSTGMAGNELSIYTLQQNSKFGVLRDVDSRRRFGLETAWAFGPFAIQGEYIKFQYTDLLPSGDEARDADFSSWYVSALYSLTGEHHIFSGGTIKPLYPERFFNPDEGTYGAVCIAARIEHFSGDEDWITPDTFVSVREADAYSVAVNWILLPMLRCVFDYTYTDFSDPIRSRVKPDGNIDYINSETVLTCRFSINF